MLESATSTLAATVMVQPLPYRSIVSLSAFRGQSAALGQALGVDLPAAPRRITVQNTIYLWSGVESWLAISENPELFANLSQSAANLAAITEQGDGRSLFRVSGPFARQILAKLVPIDLHPSVFPPDAVALTLAAHIGITLWAEDDGGFILACFRSFGAALHHALIEAAAEFENRG